jgi:hypothetical protein
MGPRLSLSSLHGGQVIFQTRSANFGYSVIDLTFIHGDRQVQVNPRVAGFTDPLLKAPLVPQDPFERLQCVAPKDLSRSTDPISVDAVAVLPSPGALGRSCPFGHLRQDSMTAAS